MIVVEPNGKERRSACRAICATGQQSNVWLLSRRAWDGPMPKLTQPYASRVMMNHDEAISVLAREMEPYWSLAYGELLQLLDETNHIDTTGPFRLVLPGRTPGHVG